MLKNLPPIVLTILGLTGLMVSWSCLPPLPLARVQVQIRPKVGIKLLPILDGAQPTLASSAPRSPSPSLTPAPESTASAAPVSSPTPPPAQGLIPAAGRTYRLVRSGTRAAEITIVVTAVDTAADTITYTRTVKLFSGGTEIGPEMTLPRSFGVFWVLEGPLPLTQDVLSLPRRPVTVVAGSYDANELERSDGSVYAFVDGMVVKAIESDPASETVLAAAE